MSDEAPKIPNDAVSVATTHEEDGILPYMQPSASVAVIPEEEAAAPPAPSAQTEPHHSDNDDDAVVTTTATDESAVTVANSEVALTGIATETGHHGKHTDGTPVTEEEFAKYKAERENELKKRATEADKLCGVRQTLESTMDIIKMALRSIDYSQQHPVFRAYIAKRPELGESLDKSKKGLTEAIEFFRSQDVAVLKAWLPEFAAIIQIAEDVRRMEMQKEKEAAEYSAAQEAEKHKPKQTEKEKKEAAAAAAAPVQK